LRVSQTPDTWQHLRTPELLPLSRAWRLWQSALTGRF
jgi:hypothetical protein